MGAPGTIDASIAEHLPIVLGILTILGGAVLGILKSYRWLIDEIRTAIREAMAGHEKTEGEWQKDIERRLDAIESKVDRLMERGIHYKVEE